MVTLIFTNFLIVAATFIALWAVSVVVKDASIVDIYWGPSIALPALLTWARFDGAEPRAAVITVLVTLWAARLGFYLAIRNLGHGEDIRYQRMRERAGGDRAFAKRSLVQVFLLQCLISFFVSLPTQIGQIGSSTFLGTGSGSLGILAWLGIGLFFIGLTFEAVGDAQLRAFKKDPANKGKLMDQGLWGWTRHPNYFGDACVWFGLTMIALESAYGIYTILSPLVMLYFLYALSGKALLERMMSKKYPDFEDYKKRVSGFFPRPPRKLV